MYPARLHARQDARSIPIERQDHNRSAYLNENWQHAGGARLLKNGHDVETTSPVPDNGTPWFKRSDNSWHGHHPFDGPRRSLQMNWMTSESSRGFHAIRHKLSAAVKKLTAA
jgi:hypothetical protein